MIGEFGELTPWVVLGVAIIAVVIIVGERLYYGWLTNVLRNNLEAKRRLHGRAAVQDVAPAPGSPWTWLLIVVVILGGLGLAVVILGSL